MINKDDTEVSISGHSESEIKDYDIANKSELDLKTKLTAKSNVRSIAKVNSVFSQNLNKEDSKEHEERTDKKNVEEYTALMKQILGARPIIRQLHNPLALGKKNISSANLVNPPTIA